MELPKIISVDDHVVEPPTCGRPGCRRSTARRVRASNASVGAVLAQARREVRQHRGPRRLVGRRLVLRGPPHLRAQAVRRDPARGDARRRPLEVRPHEDGDGSPHLRRDAPRLLRARRAHQGLRAELGRRFPPLPDVPALLRADLPRSRRPRSRARVREGVQRLDGRGVVRPVERDEHPAVHHAALGRAARGRRDPPQRGAACAFCFSELPTT